MLAWAREQRRTRTIVLEQGDKAQATLLGRSEVRGEYFCFLDDDDEFLPNALAASARDLEADASLDCVATNGIYITPSGAKCVFKNAAELIDTDHAESVLRLRNWLASCGGMFRTRTVGLKYFEDLPRHREWTVIAFRIASELKVRFVNRLAYRVISSSASQSKRDSYIDSATESLQAMLRWTQNVRHSRAIRRQMADANHYISSYYRMKGDFPRAWQAHRASIKSPNGWKFLPYTFLLIARQTRPARSVLESIASSMFRTGRPRTRRVALSGLSLFSNRLALQLERAGVLWKPQSLRAGTRFEVLTAFFTILRCDVWYSIGEPRNDRRIEWLARALRRPRVVHWVGSDVSVLQSACHRQTLSDPRYTHLVEADWIADELREAGLKPHIVPLPPTGTPEDVPPMPSEFTVLLYVPRTRADFYGKQYFEEAMRTLSHLPIRYLVVGGGLITAPDGVKLTNLGWLSDLTAVYRETTVLVRFTQHDGLSLMVLEAMATGRYVLWTQTFPFCETVRSSEDIQRALAQLYERHAAGALEPQGAAVELIRAHYSEAVCIQQLAAVWEQCVRQPEESSIVTAPARPGV